MATTKLSIYNGACLLAGERRLSSLTENVEARYWLDEIYNDNGVRYCLEQAQWHFAMRSSKFSYDAAIDTPWGLQYGFTKPDDWVFTSGVFTDEYLKSPCLNYADEAGIWYADVQDLYIKYVSDDASYGGNLAGWPVTFTDYVKAYFAGRLVTRVPDRTEKREFLLGPPGRPDKGWVEITLKKAKNKAAAAGPTTFPTRGTWARARWSNGTRRNWDGGNTGQLIG